MSRGASLVEGPVGQAGDRDGYGQAAIRGAPDHAGGSAHDFNNLLMVILGYTELSLARLPPGSAGREEVKEIENAARRAAELSRQMLAYSGKGRFEVRPLDLGELVREMGDILRVSVSKKASLQFDLAPAQPAVEADAAQLRQVVMNLIVNASEAIGEAGGTVTASTGLLEVDKAYLAGAWLQENLPQGRYVYLEVSATAGRSRFPASRGRARCFACSCRPRRARPRPRRPRSAPPQGPCSARSDRQRL